VRVVEQGDAFDTFLACTPCSGGHLDADPFRFVAALQLGADQRSGQPCIGRSVDPTTVTSQAGAADVDPCPHD